MPSAGPEPTVHRASRPTVHGPRADRGVLAQQIVAVARAAFAADGYQTTSLRSVARLAGVDPALVRYYFASKADLLTACMVPPAGFLDNVARIARAPLRERGSALVRGQLAVWEQPASGALLRSIVLTAGYEPAALDRLRQIFSDSLIGVVAAQLPDDERQLRAGLVATQLLGLAMMRFVWRIEPLAGLPVDRVVELIGPTVQRYLSDRLPAPDGAPAPGYRAG